MNSLVVRPLVAAWILLGGLFAAAPASAIDTGDIVVESIKGEVHVTMNGAERNLRAGGVLELPATINTGRDGAIELRQGATTVSVGPETTLDFPALEQRGGPIDRIVQPRGNAFYSIGKRAGRKLRVETPYLVGVIKGTQFNVAAQTDSTTISLFEGLLEIHATDESSVIDLKAGEIATLKRGDKLISVIKMDSGKAPPTQRGPSGSSGGPSAPGSTTPGSSGPDPGNVSDSVVVDRSTGSPSVVGTVVETVRDAGVSAAVDVRGTDTSASVDVGAAVGAATVDLNTGVSMSAAGTEVNAATKVDTGVVAVDTVVATNVDLGAGAVDVAANVGVAAGPVSADVGVGAAVAVVPGNLAANVDLSAAAGVGNVATVDAGVGAAVNLGSTTAIDAGAGAAVNIGNVATVDAGAGAAVSLGNTTAVDAGVGTAVNLGNVAAVDVGAGAAVNLGATGGVAAGADLGANVAGVAAAVNTTVNVPAGNVDLGVSVAGVNLNLGVDLGLGSLTADTTTPAVTTTTPTTETPTAPVVDVGGLLDSLLHRSRKR